MRSESLRKAGARHSWQTDLCDYKLLAPLALTIILWKAWMTPMHAAAPCSITDGGGLIINCPVQILGIYLPTPDCYLL